MGRLFRNYFSNRSLFYNLFDEAAKNMAEMAALLVKAVNTDITEEREAIFKQIDKLENTGDDITHKIYLALDKVIFTPINRGSIPVLASCIDDVADTIHEASERMYLYNIDEFVTAIKEIAVLIHKASLEIEKVVGLLRISNMEATIIALCRQVKIYEHQSDQVYYQALAELFANEKDAIKLIKYREILSSLENTVNRCKNTSDALEAISINRLG
jgi:predicted phosphate transport protein (TIGR00153 family)